MGFCGQVQLGLAAAESATMVVLGWVAKLLGCVHYNITMHVPSYCYRPPIACLPTHPTNQPTN
jgi:hypothetical protein